MHPPHAQSPQIAKPLYQQPLIRIQRKKLLQSLTTVQCKTSACFSCCKSQDKVKVSIHFSLQSAVQSTVIVFPFQSEIIRSLENNSQHTCTMRGKTCASYTLRRGRSSDQFCFRQNLNYHFRIQNIIY